MKKLFLLIFVLFTAFGAWATVSQLTLTTDVNNPTYYVIKNFRSGKYANYVNASTQLSQVDATSLNTLWYFVENGSGVSIVPAADPNVKLATVSSATADGAVWYVAENKINKGYYAISLNSGQNSNCWDANSAGTVGNWQPSTTDYAGTSWVIAETVVTKADIDNGTVATALSNSAFAIQKAEAIARLGALSSLAVYTEANLTAARNAADASALTTALEAFNTNLVMLCRSNKYLNVGESGGSFETTQSVIQLVSAGGGAFYLKGKTSGKYLGSVATSTAIGSDATPTTAFYFEPWNGYTVAHPTNTSYKGFQYIHNGGSGCVGWEPAGENTQFTISEPFLTDISEVDANKAYFITTADRGAWMVNNSGTAVTSTYKASFAPMKADSKQQFAFISYNEKYYLYSVSAKKFVSKSGSYTTLTDIAGDNVTLLTGTGDTGYPTVVALQDGTYHAGISNGYNPAVITSYNNLSDGGNKAKVLEVADFDPTEALETFNTIINVTYAVYDGETLVDSKTVEQTKNSAVAVPSSLTTQTFVYDYTPSGTIGTTDCTITVARTVKTGVVATLAGLSNNKAYRLVTERGTFTTDNGELANTAKSGSSYTVYNFAIVYYDATEDEIDNGNYYLWSVHDSKFVAGSGTALTDTPTAVTLNSLTGPLFKFQCGSNYMNCNANGCGFGSYSTTDAGNSVAIFEAEDFDPTPVIAAISNVASSVVANIKPFFDAAGSVLFQLKSSVAAANYEKYTAALTMCSPTTYEELLAVVSNAENFNLPQTGKFYLVKNNYNGKYMHVTASGTRGTVFADLTAEEAAKDVSAHFTFVENASHLYMSSQGEYLNWVWGRSDGYEGYTSTNFDKYVHFAVPAPGVGAFSIAYGNGEGSYAGYLGAGFYALKNTETKVVAGSPTDQTHEMAQWTFEEVSTLNINLNGPVDGNYYATLCLPFDVTIRNANAYTLEKSGNYLVPTEVTDNKVPAGTPVLLKGTSATATATINTGSAFGSPLTCALTGIYMTASVDATTDYVFGRYNGKVGFYHVDNNTFSLKANRAYLQKSAETEARGFSLMFDDEATGIVAPTADTAGETTIYNLSGQRLNKVQKGINIVNGKKVLF